MNTELIARLEAAEVGSRELDGCLYWALERPKAERAYWNAATGLPCALPDGFVPRGLGQSGVIAASPTFTTSLDAALALAERVLPHWYVYRISDERNHMSCPGWGAGLGERNGMRIEYARAKTSALALCIAILRALGAQEQK